MEELRLPKEYSIEEKLSRGVCYGLRNKCVKVYPNPIKSMHLACILVTKACISCRDCLKEEVDRLRKSKCIFLTTTGIWNWNNIPWVKSSLVRLLDLLYCILNLLASIIVIHIATSPRNTKLNYSMTLDTIFLQMVCIPS